MFEDFLLEQQQLEYYKKLNEKLEEEYNNHTVYPPKEQIFSCFDYIKTELKVVIIGQDPYHQPNQANGLAFSVNQGNKIPPSLRNIYKELNSDLGVTIPSTGDLTGWAKQGVLLLNNVLTVRESEANSHKDIGWDTFVANTLKLIDSFEQPIVFVLWGKNAATKKKYINNAKRFIVESVHPSPLSASRGFFGSKPFSKINNYLISNKIDPIKWEDL